MKNLKKTLAVVLAFAMILSMGFSAFAYTDVAEGTKVAEAVGILSNLGIFTGFEDGTFKPNDTVTRAQMAAIICRTLGYEDQAVASTGTTNFYDVPASHWASGYVNVVESLQIVNGYGNGAFGPEDQVTYEQAIKMIVVALGYELDAQAKGGWSTGYLAVAAREGITKNSNGVVGTPAVRGTIAVLVYNSLEVRLMDQKSWTPSGQDDAYGKLDETILSQYLGIRKVEGIVESVPFSDYVGGYTEDMDVEISFASGAKYFAYDEGKLKEYGLGTALTYNASLVPEANNFAGKKVVAYVGEEQDDETGDFMVYAIAEKQGANKVTTISAAQLVADNTDAGKIVYKELGATKKTELDLDTTVTVTAQFGSEAYDEDNNANTVETLDNTQELATFIGNVGNGGIITLISNDANSKIDFISVTVYTGEAVVEEVTEEDGVVMFDLYKGTLDDIDTEDEDVLSVVIKDGVVATVADIAANDTVSVVNETNDGSFVVYYVSSKTVTGKVDSYGDDSVEIGGEEYELSPNASYLNTAALSGKDGIFFLNVDGQIAHDEATVDKNYGIIIAAGTEGRKSMIDVVLADGTTASYELKDTVTFGASKVADTAVITSLKNDLSKNGADWDEALVADINSLVYDITVKNGKVTKLVSMGAVASGVTNKEFDEENMSYGNLSFNDTTVVISVKDQEYDQNQNPIAVEADDFKVGKVADFFVDGEGEDFTLAAYDYDNNDIAGLVIGTGLASAIAQNDAAVVVTDYRTKEIDDETAYVIVGYQAGKKVSYTILEDDFNGTAATDFAAGNVILVGAANAEGMISDLEVLYTRTNGLKSGIADKEDEYYYFGTLDLSYNDDDTDNIPNFDNRPTASRFFLTGVSNQYKTGENANAYDVNEGVVMRNSANYTLVDFSESTDPEVSKKSKGTGLFSRANQFTYTVFVRYFDDAQVEVIVYKD